MAYPGQQPQHYAPVQGQPLQQGYPQQQQQGYPAQQQGGYQPPPQQQGYPPQQQSEFGAPPQQQGYRPQQQSGFGAPQQNGFQAPQQQYPPQQSGYNPAYAQPVQQPGYSVPQQQQGYAAPQQQQNYAAPQHQAYGAPPQQNMQPVYNPNAGMQAQLAQQQRDLAKAQQSAAEAQAQLAVAKQAEQRKSADAQASDAFQAGQDAARQQFALERAETEYAEQQKRATVKDFPNFNPDLDAQQLRKAMKGLGTDTKTIVHILAKRSNRQRQIIAQSFTKQFTRTLRKDLESELSGNIRKCVKAMMKEPAEYDAYCCRKAMEGLGCDEETLLEVICTRSTEELTALKAAFQRDYKRDLASDVSSETKKLNPLKTSYLREILCNLLEKPRDPEGPVNVAQAKLDARTLYEAGEGKWGTNQDAFIEIFTLRSWAHLKEVFVGYQQISKYDIRKSIKREMGGTNTGEALLAIAGNIRDLNHFFAIRIKKSMEGIGTDEKVLTRIVVSRSEKDLACIRDSFAQYDECGKGQTLAQWIRDDVDGDYKRCLHLLLDAKL